MPLPFEPVLLRFSQLSGLPASFIEDAQAIKAHIVARAVDPARPLTSMRRLGDAAPAPLRTGTAAADDTEARLRHDACVEMLRVSADLATRLSPLYAEVHAQVQVSSSVWRVSPQASGVPFTQPRAGGEGKRGARVCPGQRARGSGGHLDPLRGHDGDAEHCSGRVC